MKSELRTGVDDSSALLFTDLYELTMRTRPRSRRSYFAVVRSARAVALLEREELLASEVRHLQGGSYRLRCELEAELAEIHRLLIRLGLRN